jgi:hypothetical protein
VQRAKVENIPDQVLAPVSVSYNRDILNHDASKR